jgi:hypothetical protein
MAHELLNLPGRTEGDGLGPFFSRGFIESGIARNVVPVLRCGVQTGANLAAHSLWRSKKERKENEDESIWKNPVDWSVCIGAGGPFFGLCGCERAGRW